MVILFSLVVRKTHDLATAAILSGILGLIVGPVVIAANTVIHQASDNEMRGKVFSGLEVVIHFAFLAAMLLSSLLSEYMDRFWILIGVGCIFLSVGLAGLSGLAGRLFVYNQRENS